MQVRRGCALFALNPEGREIFSGWGPATEDPCEAARALEEMLARLSPGRRATLRVGIDAPRRPLPAPREWYWQGARSRWRRRQPSERGAGRHCEVVVSALGLGRPQWTPLDEPGALPAWMKVGFALFERVRQAGFEVSEVFPSASLRCLSGSPSPRIEFSLASFQPGKTDMLDALVAAATLREFTQGRGWEAPGGDGLGSIVLPGSPPQDAPGGLFAWPERPK